MTTQIHFCTYNWNESNTQRQQHINSTALLPIRRNNRQLVHHHRHHHHRRRHPLVMWAFLFFCPFFKKEAHAFHVTTIHQPISHIHYSQQKFRIQHPTYHTKTQLVHKKFESKLFESPTSTRSEIMNQTESVRGPVSSINDSSHDIIVHDDNICSKPIDTIEDTSNDSFRNHFSSTISNTKNENSTAHNVVNTDIVHTVISSDSETEKSGMITNPNDERNELINPTILQTKNLVPKAKIRTMAKKKQKITSTDPLRKAFQPLHIDSNTELVPKETSAKPVSSSLIQFQRDVAGSVASAFTIDEPFNPLFKNCHTQTIGGFLLRQKGSGNYVPKVEKMKIFQRIMKSIMEKKLSEKEQNDQKLQFWDEREKINAPDGDWFHADMKYAVGNEKKSLTDYPTVILLHGLNSNSISGVSLDMAKSFTSNGMNCICLNFRGCSGEPNDTLRFYHLGFTEDIHYYLQLFNERCVSGYYDSIDKPTIYLAGFSLGANVVLKCLGELGEDAFTKYNVYGSAVLCAPLDNVRNTACLAKPGINKSIYTKNLLVGLKERARIAVERYCDNNINTEKFDYLRALKAQTIQEFDDACTAQIYGFDSCWDYYTQTSSLHFLDSIAVPTIIINAKDDPFFDTSVWPIDKSYENGGNLPIKFVLNEHGGHLGFAFHQVSSTDKRLDYTNDVKKSIPLLRAHPCWASMQASAFLQHVQDRSCMILLRKGMKIDLFDQSTMYSRMSNFRSQQGFDQSGQ